MASTLRVTSAAGLAPCRRARASRTVCAAEPSRLWTPTSARPAAARLAQSSDANTPLLSLSGSASAPIVARRGEEAPNPMVMERFQSVISSLFSQRVIRLGGAVDDDMANLIVAQLLYLDSQDPETDITVYVNSPGGSVTAGMAIFDTMRHIRPACSTVCVGLAASMGAFLLASGRKGKRFSLPNSRIMIHQPLGGAQGQAADIEIQANEIMHHKATLNGYLAEFSGKPLERIMEDTDRDFFMGAQEAVDYGLIDGVLSNERWKAFQQKGIPLYPVYSGDYIVQ